MHEIFKEYKTDSNKNNNLYPSIQKIIKEGFLDVAGAEIFLQEWARFGWTRNLWILTSLQFCLIMCLEDTVYVPSISGFEGYKESVLKLYSSGCMIMGILRENNLGGVLAVSCKHSS